MKYLILFIVSFASASVFAGEWIADSSAGCRVWNAGPKPNETITWSGSCKDGYATGSGVLIWFLDGKMGARYEGGYVDGRRNGRGKHVSASGEIYEGDFVDGKPNGRGKNVYSDGSSYNGGWVANVWHGSGQWVRANGDRFLGEWVRGVENGVGMWAWADGNRYIGEFQRGKPHGFGGLFRTDGVNSIGYWNNGCYKDGVKRSAVGVDINTCPY